MEKEKNKKYITLKEAAKISGYSPDYIGQLIRQGKIVGKPVYCNIAWMTTEEAVQSYLKRSQDKDKSFPWYKKIVEKFYQFKTALISGLEFIKLLKILFYLVLVLSLCFSLVLFYIFSVSIDKKFERQAIEKMELNRR